MANKSTRQEYYEREAASLLVALYGNDDEVLRRHPSLEEGVAALTKEKSSGVPVRPTGGVR